MKKCKKIIFGLLFICMLIGVTFASLTFMGVIGHTENVVNADNENVVNVGAETAEATEYWHIVFKGFAFSVKPVGTASPPPCRAGMPWRSTSAAAKSRSSRIQASGSTAKTSALWVRRGIRTAQDSAMR